MTIPYSLGFHPSFFAQGNGILLRYWSHLSHSWSNVFPRGVFGGQGYSKPRDCFRVVGWELGVPKRLAKHSKILKMWIMKWPVGTLFYVQRVSGEICQWHRNREGERKNVFWKKATTCIHQNTQEKKKHRTKTWYTPLRPHKLTWNQKSVSS